MTASLVVPQAEGSQAGKNCRVIMVNNTFLPGLDHPAQTCKPF
jgi:hypothetical protein